VEEADKLRSARQAALSAIAGRPRPRTVAPARGDTQSCEETAESAEKETEKEAEKEEEAEEAKIEEPEKPEEDILDSDEDVDAESTADRQREMRLP
jgi:hypothetical protein